MPREVKIEIAQQEWLDAAIPDAIKNLKLQAAGVLPPSLRGMFIVVTCMRLLRCVYGSDLAAVVALRERVLADTEFWQKVDAMTPGEATVYFAELERNAREASIGVTEEDCHLAAEDRICPQER